MPHAPACTASLCALRALTRAAAAYDRGEDVQPDQRQGHHWAHQQHHFRQGHSQHTYTFRW
jgi:hypothetical protein